MAQFDRVYKYKALFNRKRAVSKQAILDEFEISEAVDKIEENDRKSLPVLPSRSIWSTCEQDRNSL